MSTLPSVFSLAFCCVYGAFCVLSGFQLSVHWRLLPPKGFKRFFKWCFLFLSALFGLWVTCPHRVNGHYTHGTMILLRVTVTTVFSRQWGHWDVSLTACSPCFVYHHWQHGNPCSGRSSHHLVKPMFTWIYFKPFLLNLAIVLPFSFISALFLFFFFRRGYITYLVHHSKCWAVEQADVPTNSWHQWPWLGKANFWLL